VHTLGLVLGCVLTPGPLLYWWTHTPQDFAVPAVYIGQALLGLLLSLTTSVYLFTVELFPARVRSTGVAIAYNMGLGLTGGLGPLISDAGNVVISPKGLVSAPAAVTILAGFVSLIAIASGHVLAHRGMMRLTHIRDSPY